jgi:hypothetical protein
VIAFSRAGKGRKREEEKELHAVYGGAKKQV